MDWQTEYVRNWVNSKTGDVKVWGLHIEFCRVHLLLIVKDNSYFYQNYHVDTVFPF